MNNNILPPYEDIKHLIQTRYLEGGDVWVACYVPKMISVIGKTEHDAIEGIREAYESHLRIQNFRVVLPKVLNGTY